ncbi:MAG: hypothetical protein ACREPB_14355 [Arenimonas sp.]
MPRWLWITLGSLLLLAAWLGLRSPSSIQATSSSNPSADICPSPDKFRRADTPLQSEVDNRIGVLQLGESKVTPMAGFSLQARVLAREDYRFDAGAEFSPTDLALGWGPMSEPGMADKLNISQSTRWYRYSWDSDGPPIPLEDIISHSANMHMIPANPVVAKSLKEISENDVIELEGWLIRIEKNDGWHWQSSLSRSDSGDGACELVYVCSIKVKK